MAKSFYNICNNQNEKSIFNYRNIKEKSKKKDNFHPTKTTKWWKLQKGWKNNRDMKRLKGRTEGKKEVRILMCLALSEQRRSMLNITSCLFLLLVQYFQQRKRLNLNGQEHRQCVERSAKYLATGEQWEIVSMVSDYKENQDWVEFLLMCILIFADGSPLVQVHCSIIRTSIFRNTKWRKKQNWNPSNIFNYPNQTHPSI